MPSDPQPVTEEMVAEVQRVIYGSGHQPDHVPRLCRRALKAAQAVAPPKETAETEPTWAEAAKIVAVPMVDEALTNFAYDATADNGIRIMLAVLHFCASSPAAPATPAPTLLADSPELTEEVRKIAAWLGDEGVTHDLTAVRVSLAPLIAAASKGRS